MTIFLIANIAYVGRLIIDLVIRMREIVNFAIGLTIGVVVFFLLIRFLTDLFKLNPFGRVYQMIRQPTNGIIDRMRSSQFYYPLKKSFSFDPSILMVLIALAILWYVAYGVLNNLFFILQGVGQSLINFGMGETFRGARYMIGAFILAPIFFLMSLMSIVFVNWLFGLLRRPAYWAMERLSPILRIFEFGGVFAGWSFIILWIALTFASMAVMTIFFA